MWIKHEPVRDCMYLERLAPTSEPADIQGRRQRVLGNWVELDEGRGLDGPLRASPPTMASRPSMSFTITFSIWCKLCWKSVRCPGWNMGVVISEAVQRPSDVTAATAYLSL